MGNVVQFIRASLVGVIAMATDLGLYYVFGQRLPLALAKALSFVTGGIVGYVLSKYWVFQAPTSSRAEVVRYVLLYAAVLALNVGVNQGMLQLRPGDVRLALLTATAAAGGACYAGMKWWVFRRP